VQAIKGESGVQVFVVEIDGRGIAAFGAEDGLEAKAIAEEEGFRSDLIVLENEGKPLWDGLSEIRVREASPEEETAWKRGFRFYDATDGLLMTVVYLVPVTDPTSDPELYGE
jgi:hypothetical protein